MFDVPGIRVGKMELLWLSREYDLEIELRHVRENGSIRSYTRLRREARRTAVSCAAGF